MSRPEWSWRVRRGVLLVALLAIGSCDTFFVEPRADLPASLDLSYTFADVAVGSAAAADLSEAYDKLDQIRIVVSGGVSLDTILAFSPTGDETTVQIDLETDRSDIEVTVAVELLSAGSVIFTGGGSTRIGAGETSPISLSIAPVPVEAVLPESVPRIDAWGTSVQIEGRILLQTGDTISGLPFSWQSTNTSVVTVSSAGVALSVGDGTAFIVGTYGQFSDNVRIDVTALVATVDITPELATVEVGGTVQLEARPQDRNGNLLPRSVRWSSSNTFVAVVSVTGTVTGIEDGSTFISAEADGIIGRATVAVGSGGFPATISNPLAPLVGVNDDRCTSVNDPDSPVGSLFAMGFDYTDPSRDVTVGEAFVSFYWVRGPGDSGTLEVTLIDPYVTGDPSTGTISIGICNWFGDASSIDYTMVLTDASGDASNPVSVVISKPPGGNVPPPGTPSAPGVPQRD